MIFPENTQALLLDLDGVIIDSSRFEREVLEKEVGKIDEALWQRAFPLPLDEFLQAISRDQKIPQAELLSRLRLLRETEAMPFVAGARECISAAQEAGIKLAVVSNNPASHTSAIIANLGLDLPCFGTDNCPPKPAPDIYLQAARSLGVSLERCVVIEDSAIGVAAARAAEMTVYGLGKDLGADRHYRSLFPECVDLCPGDPSGRHIDTPSEFLSHMLEHLLWRTGTTGQIIWHSDDYLALGQLLAEYFPPAQRALAGLDGSLALISPGVGKISGKCWITDFGVEDLGSSQPLLDVLQAFAIDIDLCALDDPHHGWEAIYRALGSGLSRRAGYPLVLPAKSSRETAESVCSASWGNDFYVRGAPGWQKILAPLAPLGAGVEFSSKGFTSSHVLAEDMGITLGRAARLSAEKAIAEHGICGYGFCLAEPMVSLSLEGRAGYYEIASDLESIKRAEFSQTTSGIPLEDLDDFLAGFAQGMQATVSVVRRRPGAEEWQQIYSGFALALHDLFLPEPARRGMIVGTKALL